MKFLSPSALFAAALLSLVAALPFLPAAKTFLLELQVASSAAGMVQAYYDDGAGMREELSGRVEISASASPRTYRIAVPPGRYRALRLDPPNHGVTITLAGAKLVSHAGRTVAALPLGEFKAAHQIASVQMRNGGLEVTTARGSDDPQLALTLGTAVEIRPNAMDFVRGSLPIVAGFFTAIVVVLFVLSRMPSLQNGLRRMAGRAAARPGRAVLAVAAMATVLSAYPVVFLGKSFVSPNLGTVLLYDDYPTLPGYSSKLLTDVKLSDIGAVMWQHVPFSTLQHRALRQGELPLWNRYNAAGVPLLAQGQSMFGDPLHLWVIAMNGAAWAWDMKYVSAKWLFAAGLGLCVLLVAAQGSPGRHAWAAAAIVAGAAPFIGFFLYRVNHPAFFSLCYAPWPLYCLLRIAHADSRRSVAGWCGGLVVANLALMNSGTVKEAYMLLVAVNVTGGVVLLTMETPWRERGRKLAAIAWTGLVFLLVTMPVWATFLQTLKNAYTGYNAASAFQIQPTLLLGAFDELFYRPLMSQDRVFSPSLNFLLLAGLLYFAATLRLHFARRAAMAVAACSLVPLALAFGLVPPAWIVRLPFLSNIAHLDNTFSCVLIVLWSVLAGVGFATAAGRLGTREGRHDLAIGGLLLGALVFGWIAFGHVAHRPILGPTFTVHAPGQALAISPFIWSYLLALLTALTLLAMVAQRVLAAGRCGIGAILLLATCVGTLLWRHGLHGNNVGFENYICRPTPRVNFHAKSEAMQFMRRAHAREPVRGYGVHGNFFPGWTGVYGLETVHGPDALVNTWMRELAGVSGVERIWDWRLYSDATTVGRARPFFDALNVRYYFDRMSDQGAMGRALKLVQTADLDIYESPTAWPRAFFVDQVERYAQPAELVEKMRAANGRAFAALQENDAVSQAATNRLPSASDRRIVIPASDYALTENTTAFTVRANGPGVVVLSEAFWPGDFRVEVNGRPAEVIRVNHAFKGVVLERAGEYRIRFSYWPRHFTRHLAFGGLGAAMGLASLVWATRRERMPRVERTTGAVAGETPAISRG